MVAAGGLVATGKHTIQPGETVSGIASRYRTTVAALAGANGITDPDHIIAGHTLTVPGDGSDAAGTVAGGPASTQGPAGTVAVQPGDTVALLASRTGVPAETLVAANGLTPPYTIYAGTRLFLAAPNAAAATPASLQCPVPGARFVNDWGYPRAGTGFHYGNDLFAPAGTPVLAPAGGQVTQVVGPIGGNQFRLVADNGTRYWGSHLATFGTTGRVEPGDLLGTVGDTGDARGGAPHLHFEIHPGGGAAVNPYPSLVAACR